MLISGYAVVYHGYPRATGLPGFRNGYQTVLPLPVS